nr:MAG TPA: hypothetical protein [Caudoviricetes sp.]
MPFCFLLFFFNLIFCFSVFLLLLLLFFVSITRKVLSPFL